MLALLGVCAAAGVREELLGSSVAHPPGGPITVSGLGARFDGEWKCTCVQVDKFCVYHHVYRA